MRRLVLHFVPSLHIGGVNRSLLTLVQALEDGPFEHVVCSITDHVPLGGLFESRDIRVRTLGHSGGRDAARTLARLRHLLVDERVGLVHSHLKLAELYGGAAARLTRVPHVSTHHWIAPRPDDRALRVSRRLLVDRYVAVSEAVKASMVKFSRIDPAAIVVVPNGVDPSAFHSLDRNAVRASFGVAPSDPLLVNVGRLDEAKDQVFLVRLMTPLVAQFPEAKLFIVGEGVLRDVLTAEVEALGLGAQVTLLGGRDDVPELLAAADVVVSASSSEGHSVALLEAMAAGRPIVASDIPANRESLAHGVEGVIASTATPGDYLNAVIDLLRRPDHAAQLGRSAQDRVAREFEAQHAARSLERVYGEMLDDASARGFVSRLRRRLPQR